MADDIRIGLEIVTDADRKLAQVEAAAKEAGEAVDAIDDETVEPKVDTSQVERLGHEGDRSRGVLANMAGNTAQDLGAITGASGSAGVAIGQLAEYAAEGGISLQGLAATGPAIAIAGVVMNDLADKAERMKEINAFNAAEVEAYTKAIRDGGTELENIVGHLREVEQIQFSWGSHMIDLVPILARMGLGVEDFAQLVAGTDAQINDFKARMEEIGTTGVDLQLVLKGVEEQQDLYAAGTEAAGVITAVFGQKVDDTRSKLLKANDVQRDHYRNLRDLNEAYDDLGGAVEDTGEGVDTAAKQWIAYGRALQRVADRQKELNDRVQRALELQRERIREGTEELDKNRGMIGTMYDLADSQAEYDKTLKDSETTATEAAVATHEMGSAYIEAAGAWADSQGAAAGSKEAIDGQVTSLMGVIAMLDPSSPLRAYLGAYIQQILSIPKTAVTRATMVYDAVGAPRSDFPAPASGGGGRGTRPQVMTVNNFHPAAPTPTQVRNAQQEYNRVNGGATYGW